MSTVNDVLKELVFRISAVTKKQVITLNSDPAVIDPNVIYIISPSEHEIIMEPMISSDSWMSYRITLYEINHVQNMNRQAIIGENIYSSIDESTSILKDIFSRREKYLNIAGACVKSIRFGTSTWVTDTKVFSGVSLTLNIVDVFSN